MKRFASMFALAAMAISLGTAMSAQTPSPVTPTSLDIFPAYGRGTLSNIYAIGSSYSVGATPAVAGTGLYAHLIAGSGTYAFTAVDLLPNTIKPFTVTTNFGVGIAQKLATIGSVSIYIPTDAGITINGSNTGWNWSGGALASIPLKKGYYLMPTARYVKSSVSNGTGYQPIIGILFGFGS